MCGIPKDTAHTLCFIDISAAQIGCQNGNLLNPVCFGSQRIFSQYNKVRKHSGGYVALFLFLKAGFRSCRREAKKCLLPGKCLVGKVGAAQSFRSRRVTAH